MPAHGYDGLVLATFMAGLLLLFAGCLRIGNLIAYVPEPVINGFTVGIAIIIATSQLKDFFGLTIADLPADYLEKITALWQARDGFSLAALLTAAATLALILGLRHLFPKMPGLFIAVAMVSLIVFAAGLPVDTITSRFGTLPTNLPIPALPELSIDRVIELFPSALVIAFLAGVESLLSAMVADRMIQGQHRPNAEVTAQGCANIASALFAGMPVTGAIARTATNIRAGGRTPIAGIIHAVVILIVMLVAGPLAGYLALPAMAALLMLTAWTMSEPHKWKSYLTASRSDRLVMLTTLVLTVVVDLTVAIGVGVCLGLALRLRARKKPPDDWSMPER